ncbi:cytochrome ubiquinol oxidase subunit I [Deinococcus hopiensis]|uniref:cytochrome ubiquinol oxidase subunit I n=1 Tax=Deinococcus hopiensis TaxID=309885 RepID=UPI0009FD8D58|nr:cytochrome ubiquinol oxidase subunit I [Deinococcus hopiensis]
MNFRVTGLPRFQFASTGIFHFFSASLTVGLAFCGDEDLHRRAAGARASSRQVSNSSGHLFLINVAEGVVTGIVQEFQFGMNW